ncbi:MAG: SDR family NAD(P)-dependent oxidoreductase [Bacteroidia bacterium]|nr:SDR family NAD(P)-dependent oxidoreductase [Bacteroidia bacterium]
MKGKVLVTGADGFIGSHLTEHLVSSGYEVRAFVLYNSFGTHGWLDSLPADVLQKVELFPGDIRDSAQVQKALTDVETVFHLAALISIPYSYEAPEQFVQVNTGGTLNVLQAARNLNTSRLIFTSTSEVYGTAQYVPMDEKHPLSAQSPYSASKIAADKLAESFFRSFGLPVAIVRPFNTYGPRQSLRAVIPSVIAQLLRGEKEILLGNPAPTRDFVFVTDTAKSFRIIAESKNTPGEEINVATQSEISIGELVQQLITAINPEAKIVTDPGRIRPENSEVLRLLGSHQKLKNLTGWVPETPLQEGLRQTIEWYSNPKNLVYFNPIGRHL